MTVVISEQGVYDASSSSHLSVTRRAQTWDLYQLMKQSLATVLLFGGQYGAVSLMRESCRSIFSASH
jgi:hypothetical protein